jgi:glutathione synthase/RimK-type ligase-like ATP-grasp enzyme
MLRANDAVLLVTHSGDYFTIDRVAEAVRSLGGRPFRFDTDRFPTDVDLVAGFDGSVIAHRIGDRGVELSSGEIRSVWMRRLWSAALPDIDPQFRELSARESLATVTGFLDGLTGARFLDPLPKIEEASNKLLQLRLAAGCGLAIPRTRITNVAAEVVAFAREVGPIIGKLLLPLSQSMQGNTLFMYTSEIKPDDLEALEGLRQCPMVFQERVAVARELRVIYVGGRFFTGALGASEGDGVDWRRAPGDAPWQLDEPSAETKLALTRLMEALSLRFGAIDIIRRPDGKEFFLEVNPVGEWGMLERDLGHSISGAIAQELMA